MTPVYIYILRSFMQLAVTEWIEIDSGECYWLTKDAVNRIPEMVAMAMETPRADYEVRCCSHQCTQTYHSLVTGV